MNAYEVKVTTKLGSVYENTIIAESEEEAIARAKKKYPLQQKISIVRNGWRRRVRHITGIRPVCVRGRR